MHHRWGRNAATDCALGAIHWRSGGGRDGPAIEPVELKRGNRAKTGVNRVGYTITYISALPGIQPLMNPMSGPLLRCIHGSRKPAPAEDSEGPRSTSYRLCDQCLPPLDGGRVMWNVTSALRSAVPRRHRRTAGPRPTSKVAYESSVVGAACRHQV